MPQSSKTGSTRTRKSKAPARKAAPKAKVLQVRPTRAIYWPDETLRGKGGHVKTVGYDEKRRAIKKRVDPYYVYETDPFIEGQDHNLEPAPEGSVPESMSDWPRKFLKKAQELGGAIMDRRTEKEVGTDQLVQDVDDSDIPEPDLGDGDDVDADLAALGD